MCAFSSFDLVLIFKAFFKEKNYQHSGCWQCCFLLFPSLTRLAGFRGKSEIFRVLIFGQERQKTRFFHTNQVTTQDNNFPSICPYMRCPKSRNYNLVLFWYFLGTVVKKIVPGNSFNKKIKKT